MTTDSANGDWQNRLPSQWWFWTPEWQAGERRVDEELAAGQYEEFDTMEDFLAELADWDRLDGLEALDDVTDMISVKASVMHGKACIAGSRIPVFVVLEKLEHGYSLTDICEAYPHLTLEQVRAAIRFAAEILGQAQRVRGA